MKVYACDQFVLPLPAGHRFPMAKYARLRRRVASTASLAATAAGAPTDRPASFELHVPEAASDAELVRAHRPDYVRRVAAGALDPAEVRRIGFPWSPRLVERSRRSVGGTIGACLAALDGDGVAVNLAGGTHHAAAARGEGFCVFNDVAVAARVMQAERRARRVLIIDLDVHQGNGTAAIFRRDPSVFTFSVHGQHNYPFEKETSDLDIALPDGTDDGTYLEVVEAGLERALERSRPDLALYIAGADPFTGDRLGRLAVGKAGLAERDRLVFDIISGRAGLPVGVVMGGGYAPEIDDIVDIHFATVREAALRAASASAGV
ncbi:MAG: histone deacetylase [Gemmatimonadota bacterium]